MKTIPALLTLLVFLFLLPTVHAQKVEEISDFKVNVILNDKAHVIYSITLKNLIDKPVVPGIGEIRLQKAQPIKIAFLSIPFTEQRLPVEVSNVRVYSGNNVFKSSVEDKGTYTSIIYEIWYPVEPGKSLNLSIEYDADIVDEGLLFKTVTIPVGADMDIRNLKISVIPNPGWHLCYTNPAPSGDNPNLIWKASIPAGGIAFYTAEFSLLPLPLLPVRGYIVFWGALLALMILIGVLGLKRRR